jgi:hypothetical protein
LTDGKVLVAGGTDLFDGTNDATLASAEIYDPATGNWTPTASMSQPRQTHTATLLPSGKVFVAGGVSYFDGVFPTSAEVYDPTTGSWSPTLPLTSGHRDHFTALLPSGKILLVGGFNNTDTGPSTELFDPASAVPTPADLTLPTRQPCGDIQITFRNNPGLSFTVLSTTNFSVPVANWTNPGGSHRELARALPVYRYQPRESTEVLPRALHPIATTCQTPFTASTTLDRYGRGGDLSF